MIGDRERRTHGSFDPVHKLILVGAILGGLSGTGLAKGFSLARGEDNSILRWAGDFLERLTVTALLRYLAVAHFGRGRGE